MNVGKISVINSSNLKSNQPLAFKSKDSETGEKRSLTAKKWGVGIASFLVPGSGQIINSEVGKGILLLIPALGLLAYNRTKSMEGKVPILSLIVLFGLQLYSTIDAVKKTKPDKE